MRTKAEIIKSSLGNSYEYHDVRDWEGLIENAMDEYAKELSLGFFDFVRECDFEISDNSVYIDRNPHGIKGGYYTKEELYELFLQQSQSIKTE